MDLRWTLLKAEIIRFWRQPVRVVSLLLLIAVGLLMGQGASDREIAGDTFQWAATMAGILACNWSAAVILEDRDAQRLEMLIASGCSYQHYLVAKVLTVFLPLAASGITLVVLAFAIRIASAGTGNLLPYAAGFTIIYLPITLVALCFGMSVGTLTRNRVFAVLLFILLWVIGLFWISPEWHVADMTGEALNLAFFQPIPSPDNAVFEGVPSGIVEAGIAEMQVSQGFSQYNPLFLGAMLVLTSGLLIPWLWRRWNLDAASLISDAKTSLHVLVPRRLLALKIADPGRLLAIMLVLLAVGLLMFMPVDTRGLGFFIMEFLTPVCFAMVYADIHPSDMKRGICESQLCMSHFLGPLVQRVLIITGALLCVLAFQAYSFKEIMGMDFLPLLAEAGGIAVFLGGLAYFLGILTCSGSTASAIVVTFWALFYLSGAAGILSEYSSAFIESLSTGIDLSSAAPYIEASFPLILGISFFIVGQMFLKQPERILLGG